MFDGKDYDKGLCSEQQITVTQSERITIDLELLKPPAYRYHESNPLRTMSFVLLLLVFTTKRPCWSVQVCITLVSDFDPF